MRVDSWGKFLTIILIAVVMWWLLANNATLGRTVLGLLVLLIVTSRIDARSHSMSRSLLAMVLLWHTGSRVAMALLWHTGSRVAMVLLWHTGSRVLLWHTGSGVLLWHTGSGLTVVLLWHTWSRWNTITLLWSEVPRRQCWHTIHL